MKEEEITEPDIYTESRNSLVDDDELSALEAGFMLGYENA